MRTLVPGEWYILFKCSDCQTRQILSRISLKAAPNCVPLTRSNVRSAITRAGTTAKSSNDISIRPRLIRNRSTDSRSLL